MIELQNTESDLEQNLTQLKEEYVHFSGLLNSYKENLNKYEDLDNYDKYRNDLKEKLNDIKQLIECSQNSIENLNLTLVKQEYDKKFWEDLKARGYEFVDLPDVCNLTEVLYEKQKLISEISNNFMKNDAAIDKETKMLDFLHEKLNNFHQKSIETALNLKFEEDCKQEIERIKEEIERFENENRVLKSKIDDLKFEIEKAKKDLEKEDLKFEDFSVRMNEITEKLSQTTINLTKLI